MAVSQPTLCRREIARDFIKSSLKRVLGIGLPAGLFFLVICLIRGDKSVTGPAGRFFGFLEAYGDILMVTGLLSMALIYGALIRLNNRDKDSPDQA